MLTRSVCIKLRRTTEGGLFPTYNFYTQIYKSKLQQKIMTRIKERLESKISLTVPSVLFGLTGIAGTINSFFAGAESYNYFKNVNNSTGIIYGTLTIVSGIISGMSYYNMTKFFKK